MVVEQIGHKGHIQLLVSTHNDLRGHEGSAVDLLRLLEHHLGPLREVSLGQGLLGDPRVAGSDMGDQLNVDHAVLDVFVEVVDPPGRARLQL